MGRTIGAVYHLPGSLSAKLDKPILLYEAVQWYGKTSTEKKGPERSIHVYMLASSETEAEQVKAAWLNRNGREHHGKSALNLVAVLHNAFHRGNLTEILVGPSLKASEEVPDNVRLKQ